MAVPPVGSTPPPAPPRKPASKPSTQQPANAQAATGANKAPKTPQTPPTPAAKNAPPAPAAQPTPGAPAAAPSAPAPTGGTIPPASAPTIATPPAPNPVEQALTRARETRQRVEAELATNKFDVRPRPREQGEAEQPGITYARATQLVARLQAFQIYQANAAEQAGEVNPAQDELNQIIQGAATRTQGQG